MRIYKHIITILVLANMFLMFACTNIDILVMICFIYSHYSVNSLILFIAYHSSTTHRNETPKPGTAESAPGKFESSICHTFLNE